MNKWLVSYKRVDGSSFVATIHAMTHDAAVSALWTIDALASKLLGVEWAGRSSVA